MIDTINKYLFYFCWIPVSISDLLIFFNNNECFIKFIMLVIRPVVIRPFPVVYIFPLCLLHLFGDLSVLASNTCNLWTKENNVGLDFTFFTAAIGWFRLQHEYAKNLLSTNTLTHSSTDYAFKVNISSTRFL